MVRGDFSRVWRLFRAFLLILLGAGTGEFLTGVEAGRPRDEADEKAAELAIRAVLTAQSQAWNRGDIPGFMQGYVRDETLRFASGGSVQRGWQQTLERYQKRYDSPAKMGRLSFEDLEIQVLSGEWAEVFGRYVLKRDPSVGDATGLFTLLMAREGHDWRVLHDHTSAAEQK
jgi:ketosteroid isomerase-like protein